MATSLFNTKSPTIKRILKEASELSANPDPTLHAAPLETNLFEWHFTLQGPPATPYAKGVYHGRIILPPTYPLRPPSFRFLTPSGRFEVNREICLSISGHHEETWQPAWGIRTALWALRAFMEGDAKGQVGGMEMAEKERRRLAEESKSWTCQGCGGRSNDVILKEAADQSEGGGSEQVVPKELKLGFKDELCPEKSKDTVIRPESASVAQSSGSQHEQSKRTAHPDTASGGVAPGISNATSSGQSSLGRNPDHRESTAAAPVRSNGAPRWIDKAITGIAAALAIMIIKKIMI